MEYKPENDKYLDPPEIQGECSQCGEIFCADDLDEFDHCVSCAEKNYEDGSSQKEDA